MFKVILKNENQIIMTKEFETQKEAFDWAVNNQNEEANLYDITEE